MSIFKNIIKTSDYRKFKTGNICLNMIYCRTISFVAAWTPLRDACIRGRNDRILTVSSVEECMQQCELEQSFVCASIDYNNVTDACHLSQDTSSDAGTDFTEPCYLDGWVFAERISFVPVWTPLRNACIRGMNDKTVSANSAEECKQQCEMEEAFVCASIDYNDRNGDESRDFNM